MLLAYMFTNILTDFRDPVSVYSYIDTYIPFIESSIIFYATGYPVLLGLPVLLLDTRKEFLQAMIGIGFIALTSCLVFLVLPTTTFRPNVVNTVFETPYIYLHLLDGPYNCLPSMHVSLSCFVGWFLHKQDFKTWPLVIAFLVTISTVLTKQHAIIDIFGGLIIACSAFKFIQSKYFMETFNVAT